MKTQVPKLKEWLFSIDEELFSEVLGKKLLFNKSSSKEEKYLPVIIISLILFFAPNITFFLGYLEFQFIPTTYTFINWNYTHFLFALGIIVTFTLKKAYVHSLDQLRSSGNISQTYFDGVVKAVSPRIIRVSVIGFFILIILRNWLFISPLEVSQVQDGIITNPLSTGFYGYLGACWMSITSGLLGILLLSDFFSLLYISIYRPWRDATRFKIIHLHPDDCGGFQPLGNFALKLSTTYFLFVTLLTVRVYIDFLVLFPDQASLLQEIQRRPFLTLWFIGVLVTIWFLGFPIFFFSQYSFHRSMKQQKQQLFETYFNSLRKYKINTPTLQGDEAIIRLQLIEGIKLIKNTRAWPFDISVLKKLILAAFSPILIQGWVTLIFAL